MGPHVLEDFGEAFLFTAADFGSGPALVADVFEGGAHGGPVDIAIADFAEAGFDAPVLDVEFHNAAAQGFDPLGGFAEALVIPDVEIGTDPG